MADSQGLAPGSAAWRTATSAANTIATALSCNIRIFVSLVFVSTSWRHGHVRHAARQPSGTLLSCSRHPLRIYCKQPGHEVKVRGTDRKCPGGVAGREG